MNSNSFRSSIAALTLTLSLTVAAQTYPRSHADEARVDRLLSQMTLAEKVGLIRGGIEPASTYQGQAGYLPGVPRLHIPSLRLADGPPGLLTRVPSQAETATMGVAATFSVRDAEANGIVIGKDARSLGIDVCLQPFINLDRDITFGRGFNTFGEDPFLTAQMGAAEIRGIQSQDVMAMAKHYVGYSSNRYNVFIDQQTLHEVYAAPFAAAVDAGVASIMCSYNRINGVWACGNADTQKTILKNEIGFRGFITSDWGAVHSADFINQGLDMEMPGATRPERGNNQPRPNFFVLNKSEVAPPMKRRAAEIPGGRASTIPEEPSADRGVEPVPWSGDGSSLYAALRNGSVTEATITAAARRVLSEMDRFGYLDGTQKHSITPQPVAANAVVIEKTSEDSAVLLRNEGRVLPLKPSQLSSLAVIGPTGGQVDAIGIFGERSGGLPARQVGPLAALRKLAPTAHITYAIADDMTGTPIPEALLSHDGKPGLLRTSKPTGATTVDAALNFTLSNHRALPPNTTAQWRGELNIPADGEYWIYLQVLGSRARLWIDGKQVEHTSASAGGNHGDIQQAAQDNGMPTTDGLDNVRRPVQLARGRHTLQVKLSPDGSNTPAQIRLSWQTPEERRATHDQAIAAARAAHTAIVFVWSRRNPVFGLPGGQEKLIDEVARVNPNTIVVLNTSQPVAMPWLNRVKGVLEMWWPGDEGGWATAKVLLGKVSPAGRLPVTWARQLTDYAPLDPAHTERSAAGVDGKTTYSEGVLVGYRWFDAEHKQPLFPFGFGLSYTRFDYSHLVVQRLPDGGAELRFRIRNAGSVAGDEVPQAYLDAPAQPIAGVQFAPRTLAAFDRITLRPGESREVRLHISARAFEYWSVAKKRWLAPARERRVQIGASSRDFRLQGIISTHPAQ